VVALLVQLTRRGLRGRAFSGPRYHLAWRPEGRPLRSPAGVRAGPPGS